MMLKAPAIVNSRDEVARDAIQGQFLELHEKYVAKK
jgi:hypothetical protein